MEESQISDGAKKRFAEIKPENYIREYKRIGRKLLRTQFVYALIMLMGFLVPFFLVYMVQINPFFSLAWAGFMGYALVMAFKHTEWPLENLEVQNLILKARTRAAQEETAALEAEIEAREKAQR